MLEVMQERVEIAGPRGALQGELAYPLADVRGAALLVSPHPHMGGTMDNNVIAALAADLPLVGMVTLRFNYAPLVDLAASMAQFWATGHAPEDAAMIEEAVTAAQWLRTQCRQLPWLAMGYSFGAFAATHTRALQPGGLALISPTLSKHDYNCRLTDDLPLLVVYSDNDFATPRQQTERWLASLRQPVTRLCISGADHFYKRLEPEICAAARQFALPLMGQDS